MAITMDWTICAQIFAERMLRQGYGWHGDNPVRISRVIDRSAAHSDRGTEASYLRFDYFMQNLAVSSKVQSIIKKSNTFDLWQSRVFSTLVITCDSKIEQS